MDKMEIRLFDMTRDYSAVKEWVTDERTHNLWCAGRLPFMFDADSFAKFIDGIRERNGDIPYVAVLKDKVVGFYTYSLNKETGEGMIKFVIVDPKMRGKGIGSLMMRLAAEKAFEDKAASAVHLNVFSANPGAKRCYEKAGFTVRNITEGAFPYKDETWDRINMIVRRSGLGS